MASLIFHRWWHDWRPDQFDELAGSLIVGRKYIYHITKPLLTHLRFDRMCLLRVWRLLFWIQGYVQEKATFERRLPNCRGCL